MLYVMLVGAYPFERPEDKTDSQKLQKMIQVQPCMGDGVGVWDLWLFCHNMQAVQQLGQQCSGSQGLYGVETETVDNRHLPAFLHWVMHEAACKAV